MKWSKFLQLQAKHPFLSHDISWRGTLRDPREFVRTKIGFIAFRPFESLDLGSKYSSRSTPLKSNYVHVRMEMYEAVEYQISFHIEGEPSGSRLRHVDTVIGDGSIQAHIDDLTAWYASCDAFDGKQLVWERVVKRTVKGSSHVGVIEMNLEIFLFPPRYRWRSMPWKTLAPADPSTSAHVSSTKMPPIISKMA